MTITDERVDAALKAWLAAYDPDPTVPLTVPMRAAIEAALLPSDGNWRDISTAPKDGTKILTCHAGREGVSVAWWYDRHGRWIGADWRPTHWHLLPAPLPASPSPSVAPDAKSGSTEE
jgi:hypothetical protein